MTTLNEWHSRLDVTVANVVEGNIEKMVAVSRSMSNRSQPGIAEVVLDARVVVAFDIYRDDITDKNLVKIRIIHALVELRDELNEILGTPKEKMK